MSERANAGRGNARILPRATAGNRQRFRDSERDEAFVGESPDRGVDCADRRRPSRAAFDLTFDRDGVGVVAESLQGGEDENFELAEEIAFGHAGLSTKAKIYWQGGWATGDGRRATCAIPPLSNVLPPSRTPPIVGHEMTLRRHLNRRERFRIQRRAVGNDALRDSAGYAVTAYV